MDLFSSSSVGPVAKPQMYCSLLAYHTHPTTPPPVFDVPTFAARYPHIPNDAKDPSSKRWNSVGEN